ncbi:hypothetical protein ACFWTC_11575 [Streptomyces sp. NPDC058619]|uniref:hypothetical protein n=1 Tax=Streptomyces sp. NPDC058619 TaxID=3346559 RepID=UPI00366100A5
MTTPNNLIPGTTSLTKDIETPPATANHPTRPRHRPLHPPAPHRPAPPAPAPAARPSPLPHPTPRAPCGGLVEVFGG